MPQNEELFLPITNIFDVDAIRNSNISQEQLKQILIRIVQAFNETNIVVNLKDTGIYSTIETVNGQTFPPNPTLTSLSSETPEERQVLRKLVVCGALPNNTTKAVAHGITVGANTEWTRIYGAATKPTATYAGIPLVYLDDTTFGSNVTLRVDHQNVHIKTTADMTAFTKCNVIIEYLQD